MRFGIVGCGLAAGIHASAIAKIEGSSVWGVYDADAGRAEKMAGQARARAFSSLNALLACNEIDAVCIATPSALHAGDALAAIEHEKHVLVEKPVCLSLTEADALIRAAQKHGVTAGVVSQLRFAADVREARRRIASGETGRPVLCELSMPYYREDAYYLQSAWRGTVRGDGGGALMNQGIHGVDLMRFLMGEVRRVSAFAGTLVKPVEVEDALCASVEFASGAFGVISASSAAKPGFSRTLRVFGSEGAVELKEERFAHAGGEAGDGRSDPAGIGDDLHAQEIRAFIKAAETGGGFELDLSEARRTLALILAIYESVKMGKIVDVR